MWAVSARRPKTCSSSAYCGSSVVKNETSDSTQPCSMTLPCSMSEAMNRMFASSEFSGLVRDTSRYTRNSPAATAASAIAIAQRRKVTTGSDLTMNRGPASTTKSKFRITIWSVEVAQDVVVPDQDGVTAHLVDVAGLAEGVDGGPGQAGDRKVG